MEVLFKCKSFEELSTRELYAILQLRMEVFTIEQNCTYQDCDDRDQLGYHLLGMLDNQLVAYSRLLPKGVSYPDYCSIGRVLTRSIIRGKGVGKALMNKSIDLCLELFGAPIKIGAQSYLEKFYQEFGFQSTDHHYLEDEIPHLSMIRTL